MAQRLIAEGQYAAPVSGGKVKAMSFWNMFGEDILLFPMERLTTERLILRRMEMKDAQDIFAYGRNKEVARHVLWKAYTHIAEVREYIRYMQKKYRAGKAASWCIELKDSGRVIGTIGYMWYQPEHNSVEVGYSLAKDQWNQGIMTEALERVMHYTFMDLQIHRIEAQHEIDNPASGAVMKKCGMQYEGRLRGRLFNKGRYVDVDLYSILRPEYVARVKKMDASQQEKSGFAD